MKNKLKRLLFIILIILAVLLVIHLLKKEHQTTYKINNYEIKEIYKKKAKESYYDIFIKNNKNHYTYTLTKNLNKQKEVIKDIKTFKKNNLTCIIPIYKKNFEEKLYCNLDSHQVSPNYLIDTNNKSFKSLQKKLKKFKLPVKKETTHKTKYKNLTLLKDNIPNNYKFIIWNYKGIDILTKEENTSVKILNKDLYDNVMATTTSRYYVLFENQSVKGIKKIHYYDFKKSKLKSLEVKEDISKETYINGVVDDLIYITDRRNKKEYKINLDKEKIEEIGNEEKKYLKYDGNFKKLNKSDFFLKDQYFINEKLEVPEIDSKDIRKINNYYYYLKDNKLYQVHKNNLKYPIILFEIPKGSLKEWNIVGKDILLLVDDTVYLYTNDYLYEILTSNELNYNYQNIYKVLKSNY